MLPAFIKLICSSQLPQNFITNNKLYLSSLFFLWRFDPVRGQGLPLRCLAITLIRYTHTLGRAALDEWSVRNRDLYLTTHNTHETFMNPGGFEHTIPANEQPQTHDLDRAATRIGIWFHITHTYNIHLRNYPMWFFIQILKLFLLSPVRVTFRAQPTCLKHKTLVLQCT